jgi:hypothetical protein
MSKNIKLAITILLSVCCTVALIVIVGSVLIKNNILSLNTNFSNEQLTKNEKQKDTYPFSSTKTDSPSVDSQEETAPDVALPDANEQNKIFIEDTKVAFQQFFSSFIDFETSINQKDYDDAINKMGEFNTSTNILVSKIGSHQLSGQYDIVLQSIIMDLNGINSSLRIDFATALPLSKSNKYLAGGVKSQLSLLKSNVDTINASYQDILSELSN